MNEGAGVTRFKKIPSRLTWFWAISITLLRHAAPISDLGITHTDVNVTEIPYAIGDMKCNGSILAP